MDSIDNFEKFVQSKIYVNFKTAAEAKLYWANAAAGEMGEVCNEIKKEVRKSEDRKDKVKSEIGDVLFYLSTIANEHGFSLEDAMNDQIEKLS